MKNKALLAMLGGLLDEAELEKIEVVARSLAEASTMSIEEAACALARIGDFSMSVEDMLCALSYSMYEPHGAIHEDNDFPKAQLAFQRHMIPAFK